jgi:chlorite dismutase
MSEKKGRPQVEVPDLRERGRDPEGNAIFSDRRLFIQLLAFTGAADVHGLTEALAASPVRGALYLDLHDPSGVALAAADETPEYFVTVLRAFLGRSPFQDLTPRPELTMMGRSYSIGYESDLEHTLIRRPLERLTSPEWPWAIWYPLRRTGSFEKLPAEEQRAILDEHARLGMNFSSGGYGHDIRLDCRGIDRHDNDFLIGLIGRELFPLSAMVQAMRKTRQTSEYLASLGPFFCGKAVWQRDGRAETPS